MHISLKTLALCLVTAAAILPDAGFRPALAQNTQPAKAAVLRRNFPTLDLGASQLGGDEAVTRLGVHLPDVAAWYGKSPLQLRQQFTADHTLRIDRGGRLLFVEDAPPAGRLGVQPSAPQNVEGGSLSPLDQTFFLHSRPGSLRTIFLDVNGASISGTAWNTTSKPLTATPYDIDGNPNAFSSAELQRIQFIWQRVAEDYAPFDVDVTTEQPTQDRLTRADANDEIYGTTVVVTKARGFMSCGCGGIAYVGVFNYPGGSQPPDYFKPALVFYDMLSAGDEKAVAEAASHEAGHNMGLQHDGTSSSAYYGGQGSDPATGWAPIMGVGYYKPLVQFSRGEYADANNREDDFVVAQAFGLPLRIDDYGNDPASAAPFAHAASGASESGSMDGVIETASDHDMFAIAASPGLLSVAAAPANRSGNLDIDLRLLGPGGQLLAQANTLNALGASLAYNIAAQGTYYLDVRGTGQGDPVTTGYSNYGSLGNYRVSASYATPAGSVPVAAFSATPSSGTAPLAVSFDGTPSHDDGRVAFWYWDFGDGRGSRTGSLATPNHSYAVPGDYTARLTVIDNTGLSSSSSRVITVGRSGPQASVQSIQVVLKAKRTGTASAVATVTVVNQIGQPLPKATVTASWNGIISKDTSGKTGKTGSLTLASPPTKASGCFNLTVTGIAAAGYAFNAASPHTGQVCR